MKLSDKALRLIGLHLLERMDRKIFKDDRDASRGSAPDTQGEAGQGTAPKHGAVLRFPGRSSSRGR